MPHRLIRSLVHLDRLLTLDSRAHLTEALGPPEYIGAGQSISTQGSKASCSTLLLSGWASRRHHLKDGRTQIVAISIGGDFLDLDSFEVPTMGYGIVASTDCVVARVTHGALRDLVDDDPGLMRALWVLTLIDAATLRQWLVCTAQRSSQEHAAHFLIEMHFRMRIAGLCDADGFDLPMTQQGIAEALGISVVHMSRTCSALREQGFVDWRNHRVRFSNLPALKAYADFDPGYLTLEGRAPTTA